MFVAAHPGGSVHRKLLFAAMLVAAAATSASAQQYDPVTGQPIPNTYPQYDPVTGQPLYDPYTGQPILGPAPGTTTTAPVTTPTYTDPYSTGSTDGYETGSGGLAGTLVCSGDWRYPLTELWCGAWAVMVYRLVAKDTVQLQWRGSQQAGPRRLRWWPGEDHAFYARWQDAMEETIRFLRTRLGP